VLKVKLDKIELHRNECLFRPLINVRKKLWDVGIQLVSTGNDFDLAFIGQASYSNKNNSFKESIEVGTRYLKKHYGSSDYVLFDGQDSASLIGTYEVFRNSNAKRFLKNTLYVDKNTYKYGSVHGRIYWENIDLTSDVIPDDDITKYCVPDVDFTNIMLSGMNWLSTVNPYWFPLPELKKDIDVFAMFAYPCKDNWEFKNMTNHYYDWHRKRCIDFLDMLPKNIKVQKLIDGQKVPIEQYYELMKRSKIVIAPFGYGEIAPRDIEAAMCGAVLIKPNMDHIETIPNVYIPNQTYVPCKWNFENIQEKVETVLENYEEKQKFFVYNMRNEFLKQYTAENLINYTYKWISNLEGYGTE